MSASSSSSLVGIITATDTAARDVSIDDAVRPLDTDALLAEARALDTYRRVETDLYRRIRALLFLSDVYRVHLVARLGDSAGPSVSPARGHALLADGAPDQAIDVFLQFLPSDGAHSPALWTALGAAYRQLAFAELARQVRLSVQSEPGNAFLFDASLPQPRVCGPPAPAILCEQTPVRADLTHSCWSDIFFLAFDQPHHARVINMSIDLCVFGSGAAPAPPVSVYVRAIAQPCLRLASLDLDVAVDVHSVADLFNFAADPLGVLRAGAIAGGLCPPWLEHAGIPLAVHLQRCVEGEGVMRGVEIVTRVRDIPKGSRLAVSTTLCAAVIAAVMRLTGQTRHATGPLQENERKQVCARAILAEWLGGSGGGWQDSGGVWPGLKQIVGVARPGGGGQLLPRHVPLAHAAARVRSLKRGLILVHGGMAQNVGPLLEMVTEKYLLRLDCAARREAVAIYDDILALLSRDDTDDDVFLRRLGALTERSFFGPIQSIIPAASNAYTERLIAGARAALGDDYYGFLMLGGCAGGGMGFLVNPAVHAHAQVTLQRLLRDTKRAMQSVCPFAIDPVVYEWDLNTVGTCAHVTRTLMPALYYAQRCAALAAADRSTMDAATRDELERLAVAVADDAEYASLPRDVFSRLFPLPAPLAPPASAAAAHDDAVATMFDGALHERVRADMIAGRIGLEHNRLPADTPITDVLPGDVADARDATAAERALGEAALARGELAVFVLAGGLGTRWSGGAGTVKALHPFVKLRGAFRSFLALHEAKLPPGVSLLVSSSAATHTALSQWVHSRTAVRVSPGRALGVRLVPMARDLFCAFAAARHDCGDAQRNKARADREAALLHWARTAGEGSAYSHDALHPCGHWWELAGAMRNGTLTQLLRAQPTLRTLLLHNCDAVGVSVDATLLGQHMAAGRALTFEVVRRHGDDRGGGVARVAGALRIVEGLALPRDDAEHALSYYSTNTTWIDVDALLGAFGLTREQMVRADADDMRAVDAAIATMSARVPTYVTLKEVRRNWGAGQTDTLLLAQHEQLWGDMAALLPSRFVRVSRHRGHQLKDMAQLDGWMRDGSMAYVEQLCGPFRDDD